MSQKQIILHRGEKFSAEGSGRFAKDVVHLGKWFHPVTEKEVVFTPERIENLRKNTTAYLAAGNKIPFRDGHKSSVLATMGEWTGPFIEHKGALVGVVEPKDPDAIKGCQNGSIDGVSVVIEFDYLDSKKNRYDEVITAVDATDFPVLTEQKEFIALSRDAQGNEVFLPESLKLGKSDPDNDGDVMAQHDVLHDDLKAKVKAFSKSKDKNGADHADTKAAGSKAQEAAMRLRKQAQVIHDHVSNMTGGPVYYDRTPVDKLAAALAVNTSLADSVYPESVYLELVRLSKLSTK
jgi:hypothetical protein